jgi:putative acetyltransferase
MHRTLGIGCRLWGGRTLLWAATGPAAQEIIADVRIAIDDLSTPEIADFLAAHLAQMRSVSPPESVHALDLDALRKPEVTFWTVTDEDVLVGCGALKTIEPGHAEIKSMRTAPEYTNRGIAGMLLRHIVHEAEKLGVRRLSLETGSFDFFAPARRLYEKFGFEYCEPFADYELDPNSVYMTKVLEGGAPAQLD